MSTSIPKTQRALQTTDYTPGQPFTKKVKNAIVPQPGPTEILIKVKANAINPTDWKRVLRWKIKPGIVLGTDASGEVVALGLEVSGFQIGDHVSSFKHGGNVEDPNGGLFQEYVIVDPWLSINYGKKLVSDKRDDVVAGPITSFEGASSVTLGLVTVGLSFYDSLKLSFDKSVQKDKKILIWGGATATGFLAIQVAKKVFGLTVLTVASSRHHKILKHAGADYTFDYKDPNVVEEIQKVGGENLVFGYDTVSSHSTINQAYQALSSTQPAILENLLALAEEAIEKPRDNVKVTHSLAYLARGEDIRVGDRTIPSSPEIAASHLAFWKEIQKYVLDGV
ncbi:unnamed protein product [Ambrosiozyma monospora]|uniref:Unnamed protein product n=1 Tax=Ambrosiozyma monospora TaxID=43982 RepID=A0ACB5TSY0_AMBMO|nr:unnamed protein product [Ambrosiozyma monospora]